MRNPNEGCMHCHKPEEYNGARNPEIRYLCGNCTQGVAKAYHKMFLEIEESLKVYRPKMVRNRKKSRMKGATLATC